MRWNFCGATQLVRGAVALIRFDNAGKRDMVCSEPGGADNRFASRATDRGSGMIDRHVQVVPAGAELV